MARCNFPLTVEQLLAYCTQQVRLGNGKKYILLSDDEEGNGYHECYYQFSDAGDLETHGYPAPYDLDLKQCVTLG